MFASYLVHPWYHCFKHCSTIFSFGRREWLLISTKSRGYEKLSPQHSCEFETKYHALNEILYFSKKFFKQLLCDALFNFCFKDKVFTFHVKLCKNLSKDFFVYWIKPTQGRRSFIIVTFIRDAFPQICFWHQKVTCCI